MSTVLWANLLVDGQVHSEQSDHYALYKHAEKLDEIALGISLLSFHNICDTTDVRYNMENLDLPDGMQSTNEVMAKEGAWLPIGEAVTLLENLLNHIQSNSIRFGFFKNQHSEVVEELKTVLAFVKAAPQNAQKFNFCVVT